jgi:hypothetical protein
LMVVSGAPPHDPAKLQPDPGSEVADRAIADVQVGHLDGPDADAGGRAGVAVQVDRHAVRAGGQPVSAAGQVCGEGEVSGDGVGPVAAVSAVARVMIVARDGKVRERMVPPRPRRRGSRPPRLRVNPDWAATRTSSTTRLARTARTTAAADGVPQTRLRSMSLASAGTGRPASAMTTTSV